MALAFSFYSFPFSLHSFSFPVIPFSTYNSRTNSNLFSRPKIFSLESEAQRRQYISCHDLVDSKGLLEDSLEERSINPGLRLAVDQLC